MRHHGVEQLRVRQARVIKAQLVKRRAFLAQDRARRYAHALDQRGQQGASGRGFQVLDHMRFNPCMADHGKRVARRAAGGIVERENKATIEGIAGCEGYFVLDRDGCARLLRAGSGRLSLSPGPRRLFNRVEHRGRERHRVAALAVRAGSWPSIRLVESPLSLGSPRSSRAPACPLAWRARSPRHTARSR
jgi:hypothetical protein